jgi:hypothetical protein
VCGNSSIRDQIVANAGGLGGAGFGVNGRGRDGFGGGDGGGGGGGDSGATITVTPPPGIGYFDGFVYPERKYSTVIVFDWDQSLFSEGIIDRSSVPLIVGSQEYFTSLWPVDGHVKLMATADNVGIVTEATGGYAAVYPVGSFQTISVVAPLDFFPNIIDDTRRYYYPYDPNPPEIPPGAWIQAILVDRII